jgi:hypothetical protein
VDGGKWEDRKENYHSMRNAIIFAILLVGSRISCFATAGPYALIPERFYTFGPKIKWVFYKGTDTKFKSIGFEFSYWRYSFSPMNAGFEFQSWPKKSLTLYYQVQGGLGLGISSGPFYEFRFGEKDGIGIASDLWISFFAAGQLGYKMYYDSRNAMYSGLMLKIPSYAMK